MRPTFYVRDIPVYGDLILSPMDGYSDLPFRLICRELVQPGGNKSAVRL